MIPLKYNFRNLFVRWKTTLLTAVGFMLVVGVLVVLLAFVEGLNELSKKTGPEGNVVILRDGATDELFSDLPVDSAFSELYNRPEVLPNERQIAKRMVSHEIYSIATQELPPEQEGGRPIYRFLQVRGVKEPEVAGDVHDLRLRDGRWFVPSSAEAVMGNGIAKMLGLEVGDTFEPRPNLRWTLTGILASGGTPFDSEIWATDTDVGRNFGKDSDKQRFYTTVVVRTKDLATAQAYAESLQDHTQIRINAMTERKYYEKMAESNQMFLGVAMFIAIIMSVGGAFGLMNTMFAAISQRIKDIGVLRILGYGRWQILVSFLIESLLLAALGGGLGLLLGALVHGAEQTSYVSSGQGGGKTVVFAMIVNGQVVKTALVFILGMGILGGVLPSLSAVRLKLLDALR